MPEIAKLKDGTEVTIREIRREDLDRSLAFFAALSEGDRAYLRKDVRKPDVVERRIRDAEFGPVTRLVAVVNSQIVADGTLEVGEEGWKKHVGELRLIVAQPYRRTGLGTLMAKELYAVAASAKVEEIIVKMMRPQKAAQSIFRKLGFQEELVLPDYVKDLEGIKQDMILMRCDLEALWRQMEDFLASGDWQRAR